MEWSEIDNKASVINQRALELTAQIERGDDDCPLTLEGAIRHLILQNPTLCPHRGEALDLLYCTLGTGIKWGEDGRLVDEIDCNYLQITERPPWVSGETTFKEIGKLVDLDAEYLQKFERATQEANELELEQFSQLIDEIDERCQTIRETRWYPGGSLCNLANVPENAQFDFREGSEEVRRLIVAEVSVDTLDDFGIIK